jgi:hypothetical protein
MLGSTLVRDPKFTDRVVAETRALLLRLFRYSLSEENH